MEVERRWSQEPGWWYTLDRPTQARLLADLKISYQTPKQAKQAREKQKNQSFEDKRRQFMKKHGIKD